MKDVAARPTLPFSRSRRLRRACRMLSKLGFADSLWPMSSGSIAPADRIVFVLTVSPCDVVKSREPTGAMLRSHVILMTRFPTIHRHTEIRLEQDRQGTRRQIQSAQIHLDQSPQGALGVMIDNVDLKTDALL